MKLRTGDMWSVFEEADFFCITTNAQTRKDGALVMGRGIAKQAIERFPRLPYWAGGILADRGLVGQEYNILDMRPGSKFLLFQVKYHWKDEADLALIERSTGRLSHYAATYPMYQFHLNFPGIGNGRLKREDVLPIIEVLPDNVTVWELP